MYFADEIRTIDFEYAGMNYFPYDIGNHFCEYAGKIVVLHMHTVQALQTFIRKMKWQAGIRLLFWGGRGGGEVAINTCSFYTTIVHYL